MIEAFEQEYINIKNAHSQSHIAAKTGNFLRVLKKNTEPLAAGAKGSARHEARKSEKKRASKERNVVNIFAD